MIFFIKNFKLDEEKMYFVKLSKLINLQPCPIKKIKLIMIQFQKL